MPKFIDLTGKRFGRLTVVKYVDNDKHRNSRWLCLCDCGKEKIIIGQSLKSGATKSCGCSHIKHGHSKNGKVSKTYASWTHMIQRCIDSNYTNYHNYGGRGIKVCKRWREFKNFLEDMGEAPEGHQIDRTNNDGNYCKSNCRWVTSKINNRNKRNNHMITYGGKTQCLTDWAEEFDINYYALWSRLSRGWSTEKALTTPVRKKRPPTHQSSKRDAE